MKRKLQTKLNIITTIFVCCILFCLACFVATFSYVPEALVMAASWASAPSDTSFTQTGAGTISNPYKISSAEQLATVARNIGIYYNKSFKLANNIDVSQNSWVPIGNNVNQYSGTFDGDGYSISGLRIDASTTNGYPYAGLFGYLSEATIKNLTLVGGINSYVFAQTSGRVFAGALAGYAEVSNITNILNFDVDVRCVSTTSSSYAGGIVGYAVITNFERVINFGNVTSYVEKNTYNAWAGGIVGYFSTSQANYIKYARNDGTINSLCYGSFNSIRTYAGGIVGTCKNNGSLAPSVSLSYNTGEIYSGISGVFTTIGSTNYTSSLATQSYAGGIVGQSDIVINDTYNLGKVTANAIQKTTTGTMSLTSGVLFDAVNFKYNMYSAGKGYFNRDLTSHEQFTPGQTKYYDTPAYSGGIAGYSTKEVSNSYNAGQISGGKKTQNLIVANTILYSISVGHLEGPGTYPTKYVLIADISFTNARYYGDINGKVDTSTSRSYGQEVTNDYFTSIKPYVYYQPSFEYSYISKPNETTTYHENYPTTNKNTLGTLKREIPLEDGYLGNCIAELNYNIQTSIVNSVVRLNVYTNCQYIIFDDYYWFNPVPPVTAYNVQNFSLAQRINNTVKAPTNVTTTDLGGNTYWSKNSAINENRPYLTDFYW